MFIPKISLFKAITKLAWLKRRFDMLHQFIFWLANTVGQCGAIAGDGISYWGLASKTMRFTSTVSVAGWTGMASCCWYGRR
jgi:hypothetical protein